MAGKNFEGVWINKNIYRCKKLSWTEKILLIEINTLDNDDDGCFASNGYLAEQLGVKTSSLANMVSKLKKAGWISEIWSDGKNRGLRVCFDQLNKPDASQICDDASQKSDAMLHKFVNDASQICEPPYKDYKEDLKRTIEKEKRELIQREGAVSRGKSEIQKAENSHAQIKNIFYSNSFLQEFWKIFPDKNLTQIQIQTISNRIRDGTAWIGALEYWSSNGFNPLRVGKLCDKHDEILRGETNGKTNNRESEWARRTRESNELIEELRQQADEARLLA